MKRFVTRPFGIALSSLGFNNLLPRFAALIAIVAILIPTLFIIPAPKVSAREVTPSYVAAPPEIFLTGQTGFPQISQIFSERINQISDFRFQISDFRFQISALV